MGNLRPLLRDVIGSVEAAPRSVAQKETLEALRKDEIWSRGRFAWFDDLVDEHPQIKETVRQSLIGLLETIVRRGAYDAAEHTRAKKLIQRFFALDSTSLELCEFIHILSLNHPLNGYFDGSLKIWKPNRRNVLACALGVTKGTVEAAQEELASCGILNAWHYDRMEDEVARLWEMPDARNTRRLFYAPLKGDTLPLENFRIPEEDLRYVKKLLTSKGNKPIHIMLYGAPGTGKTTFARSLARHLGLKAWSVRSRSRDDDNARRVSLVACLNLARKHKDGFVLVDEAERLLDSSWHGGSREKDKAWINALLEREGTRVIWITNQVGHIDPAVRRRFSFSVRFEDLDRAQRHGLWQEVIARHKVGKYLTEEQTQMLAKDYEVPAAVMETAVSQAKALGYKRGEFLPAVEGALRSYETFVRNGQKRVKHPEPEGFALEGVTLDGALSGQADLTDLMERCRRADAAMRRTKDAADLPAGCATMLFYGPPGTGKTALARHIARTLDRECLVKRASDLLSCWVGMTEQQIAGAFRQAERQGAVLLIDEADTFLYSRDVAQRSWEVSQVNEFLTALEECRCFCICTTNRLDELDAAALRRFSHKVAFTWARPEQVMTLYNALLAPLCQEELTPALEGELRALTRLTPGDFHAVRGQYHSLLLDEPAATHEVLIAALRREESLKGRYAGRNVGFGLGR